MSESDKTPRMRFRISIRKLLLGIGLFCGYLACWGPTQRYAFKDVENHVFWRGERPSHKRIHGVNASSSLPLLVGMDVHSRRCYYLWCFGVVAKLPIEWSIPEDAAHWSRVVHTGMTQYEISGLLGPPDRTDGDSMWIYSNVGVFYFDEQGRVSAISD